MAGGSVGGSISRDIKVVILSGVLILVGVIALAFMNQQQTLGLQGVSSIQSVLNFFDSIPNGLASLITDFFNWLGKFFNSTSLFSLFHYVMFMV